MECDKQFASALSNNILLLSVMKNLISDRTQVEIINKVKEMVRTSLIDDW